MSLLTIIQDAAVECKIIKPTSVIGNTAPDTENLLRLANKVGDTLMRVFDWQILTKEHTFSSVATETQTGILPADFDRICKETFWDRTDQYLIAGPVTQTEWQGLKAVTFSTEENRKYTIRGGNILIIPTMEGGKTLAFEYVSNQWCQDASSTGQTSWAADTDTGVINEELITRGVIWEYLTAEGLPNASQAASYQDYFKTLIKNDKPKTKIASAGDIFTGTSRGRNFTGDPAVTGGWGLF